VDPDAVIIAEVFSKKTPQTPRAVIETCRKRLKEYDDA
jgi:phage-related protein